MAIDSYWDSTGFRQEQEDDADIGDLLQSKESGEERPTWHDISHKGPNFKALWAQWKSLVVENGLLKRKWESADGRTTISQLIVPKTRVLEVLNMIHNGSSGGHLGVNKTLDQIRRRYYWVNCREDVEEWIRKCAVCGASKSPALKTRGKMKQYISGAPFERIAIDVAGPFPKTNDGNKYILVAIDYFSKWPEAYAIPNQEASTVAKVLVDNMFTRFGVPLEIHSDQGRNFESNVFKSICEVLGIKKTRTTPLHPQSDGMVERFNRTLEEHLSKVVEKQQRDWDRHLSLFLMAYRAAAHDSTGVTPAKIVFGRETRLPCDLIFGSPSSTTQDVSTYVGELKQQLMSLHELVRERLKIASDKMKTRYDLKANSAGFQENAKVWLYNPRRRKGVSPKLSPNWEGPYKVIKRINDVVYRIQQGPRSKMKVVHLERLKPYHGDIPDRDDQG